MNALDRYVCDDALTYAPLAELGWAVEPVPWRRTGVDWHAFDGVVIRSAWDYHRAPEAFLAVLEEIEGAGVRLENPLRLVRWNVRKTYLFSLERQGVPVVPSAWGRGFDAGMLGRLFDGFGTEDLIIKPVIGASAEDTFRLARRTGTAVLPAVQSAFQGRPYIAQPFMCGVVEEGEYSLLYFDGVFSHAILKAPKAADFRVQEEHGGTIRAVEASSALAAAGRRVMATLRSVPLYARADFVRDAQGRFVLMELELIEPSLYLRTDPGAPRRFARALHARLSA